MPSIDVPLAGVTLGGYTLVSPIDQGGMGSVWLAERSDGRFKGNAAVKLLNASLLGREGEARFRREGTVLAKLTHPHIARLVDAGVSRAGQPYLVLEYVDGQHIDRFCDDQRLGIEERIRLFLDVQAAVAHAHANLIVHRDLKPSNVLVTRDGQVKLLDFGIAKLLGDDEAMSMLTREGGVALTPKYAAPEQVTAGQITTATDVYTLGVLLFELLTGHHPTGLAAGSPIEFVKAITVGKTMRLSAAALSENTRIAAERAEQRATTPDRLHRLLRGDLETIVAKALKSNPAERYASVAEFAEDLRRVLEHKPITARPDTLRYRATKFVQRHWRPLAAAVAALALLVAVVVFYTQRLQTERDRARYEADKATRISALLTDLLRGADPFRTPDNTEPTVQSLLDRGATRAATELADRPDLQTEMFALIGRTFERMGRRDKALPLLEQAVATGRRALGPADARLAQSLNNLGVLHREMGQPAKAEPLLREALAMRRQVLGPRHADVAITLVELSRDLRDQGKVADSEPLAREALDIRRAVYGEEHRETATSKSDLAQVLMRRGDLAGAERLFGQTLATTQRVLGPEHPNTAYSMMFLAQILLRQGRRAGRRGARQTGAGRAATGVRCRARRVRQVPHHGRPDGGVAGPAGRGRADLRGVPAHRAGTAACGSSRPGHAIWSIWPGCRSRSVAPGQRSRCFAKRSGCAPDACWRTTGASDRCRPCSARRWSGPDRDAEAESLMRAADRLLPPIAGQAARDRDANRARLAALYRASGRAVPADLAR